MLNLIHHWGSGDRQIPKANWLDSLYCCEFKAIERPSLNKVGTGEMETGQKLLLCLQRILAQFPASHIRQLITTHEPQF